MPQTADQILELPERVQEEFRELLLTTLAQRERVRGGNRELDPYKKGRDF